MAEDTAITEVGYTAQLGRVLNRRYELVKFIAAGGMGAVYEARDSEQDEKRVAIKLMTVETDDQLFRRRFFNEAALAASLKHPNAVRVLEFASEDDGTCFMVMELLKGEPFHKYLRRRGPLDARKAIHVAKTICDVLAEAHANGFVHRDLKPSNLYFCGESRGGPNVKVLDFGLAKRVENVNRLTMPGTMLGSPKYMSPEQLHGHDLGPTTDIYNVGLVLFRILTGRHAFTGATPQALIIAQATQAPPKLTEYLVDHPAVAELEWVIETCLQKKPEDRFANVHLLKQALQRVQDLIDGEADGGPLTLRSSKMAEIEALKTEVTVLQQPDQTKWYLPVIAAGGIGVVAFALGVVMIIGALISLFM